MEVLFSIALPFFALIGVGWLARRFGWMGTEGAFELNRFVVHLGMPALLFQIMARASFRELALPGFIAALPTGTGPFMLENMYRREAGNIAGSILVSTVVSVVTISVLITLLRA